MIDESDDIVELAPLVRKAGGAGKPEGWVREMLGHPGEMWRIELPAPAPIEIRA